MIDLKLNKLHEPLTIFLLGATGNLSKRKLLPAIFELYRQQLLPAQFHLLAVAKSSLNTLEFIDFAKDSIKPADSSLFATFSQKITYVSGDLSDLATYQHIKTLHNDMGNCGNHLWYTATLPSLYVDVARFIGQAGLNSSPCGWTKFLIEKPFGTDLATAQALNEFLLTIFTPQQIYRIDHFLAKETVQNLLTFRFGNGIFESLWNHEHIDHIQVHASEEVGVAGRGEFYDATGATRDVVQNHVLELIAMTLMDEPKNIEPKSINTTRNHLLQYINIVNPATDAVFGQYQSYTKDANLSTVSSLTETAVALKLSVNTPRWQHVPIFVRAGKKLADNATEIIIQFKEPQNQMFRGLGPQTGNRLTLRIQPNEGVVLDVAVKKPGLELRTDRVPLEFCYKNAFDMNLVEAYVKLLYDAIVGDTTLFPDATGIETAWQIIDPLLTYKRQPDFILHPYADNSFGPEAFQTLIAKHHRTWFQSRLGFCKI